ncbi:hypothetical protein Bca52824_045024 [Brassica carinata]|uniref:Uncharacterized protein n=1 Tax=Brassica carinata TaxID=52824 RepID=A0A8X7UMK1_BRACI|nr:hypothetical protein Bca52824_045024 [Brassica carinata]
MDIGGNHNESTSEEKDKASSSVEEAWEEHGCVLWDLATSETHADLMLGLRSLRLKRWADTSSSHEEHPPNIDKRRFRSALLSPCSSNRGRTYFHCFLRTLYDNAEECPRSYDKLHFDPRLTYNDSSKGYMVAFAGAKYAGRSVPTMVAYNDHVVTSFTLVIG